MWCHAGSGSREAGPTTRPSGSDLAPGRRFEKQQRVVRLFPLPAYPLFPLKLAAIYVEVTNALLGGAGGLSQPEAKNTYTLGGPGCSLCSTSPIPERESQEGWSDSQTYAEAEREEITF